MKKYLLFILLFLSLLAATNAQGITGPNPVRYSLTDPTGNACDANSPPLVYGTGSTRNIYTCQSGVYAVGTGSGSVPSATATVEGKAVLGAKDTVAIAALGTCAAGNAGQSKLVGDGNKGWRTCRNTTGSTYAWVDDSAGEYFIDRFGADPTGTANSDTAVNAAIAAAKSNPAGGVVRFGAGQYKITSLDLTSATSVFTQSIRLVGAGRFATKIVPSTSGQVLIDATGRNYWSLEGLTIESTAYISQCAIFMSRHSASTNANNNYFRDVWITGGYSKAGVVSLAAEGTSWIGCRFENSHAPANHTTFFTGWTNADISVTVGSGLTLSTGPNTNNVMIDCEFYAPYEDGELVVFSGTAGYAMTNCTVVGGTVDNTKLVVYKNPITGIFGGPVTWNDSHFEIFGTGNVIHYLDSGGSTSASYWNGINNIGGAYVIQDGTPILDYDRTIVGNQPLLQHSTWTNFETVDNIDVLAYLYALTDSDFSMKTNSGASKLTLLGYAQNSRIDVGELSAIQSVGRTYSIGASSVPTTGTWAAGSFVFNTSPSGGLIGWQCTTSGTLGTLNSGATTGNISSGTNTLTVSSASGLMVGQRITIAGVTGGPFVVSSIDGTTVKLTTNATSSGSGAAVSFSNGAFTAMYTGTSANVASLGVANTWTQNQIFPDIWTNNGFNSVALGNSQRSQPNATYLTTTIGHGAGQNLTAASASHNTFLGALAGNSTTTGGNNTFLGSGAGFTTTTGTDNVFVGKQAGYYETGSKKFFVDYDKRTDEADARQKAILYGVMASAPASQSLTINAAVTLPVSLSVGGGAAITSILSGTASLDFAQALANTCEELTITVTGAADGNPVQIGVPNALVNHNTTATFTAWISAADTVKVRRCVISADGSDPAAATVRATVTQH